MIFDEMLFLFELKSHKGKSLPLTAIRENQIKELSKASAYKGIAAGLIINFSEVEKTFFVHIANVEYFAKFEPRKSIPISWCQENGIEIRGQKKRLHFTWGLDEFLKKYKMEVEN